MVFVIIGAWLCAVLASSAAACLPYFAYELSEAQKFNREHSLKQVSTGGETPPPRSGAGPPAN